MPASVWSCQDLRDRNRRSQSTEEGSRVPRKIVSRETLRNALRKHGETHPLITATSRDPAKEFVGSTFFQPGDSTAKLRLFSSCGEKLILRSWATSVPVNDSGPVHIECRPLSFLAAYARYPRAIFAAMPNTMTLSAARRVPKESPPPTQGTPETDSLYALTKVRVFNAPSTRSENTTGSGRSASQMLLKLGKSVHRKLHSGY